MSMFEEVKHGLRELSAVLEAALMQSVETKEYLKFINDTQYN